MTTGYLLRAVEDEVVTFGRLMRENQLERAARSRTMISVKLRKLVDSAELDGRRSEARGLAAFADIAEELR